MKLEKKCIKCEITYSLEVDESRLKLLETKHVQDVFPEMPAEDRELFFISGICGVCFNEMFYEDDDNPDSFDNYSDDDIENIFRN